VDLRGLEGCVAEEDLDVPDVRAPAQQVRGDRVPEGMAGHVLLHSCRLGPELNDVVGRRADHAVTTVCDGQFLPRATTEEMGTTRDEVARDRVRSRLRQWNNPVSVSLAFSDAQHTGFGINVSGNEAAELSDTYAGCVERLQHRPVSDSHGGVALGRG